MDGALELILFAAMVVALVAGLAYVAWYHLRSEEVGAVEGGPGPWGARGAKGRIALRRMRGAGGGPELVLTLRGRAGYLMWHIHAAEGRLIAAALDKAVMKAMRPGHGETHVATFHPCAIGVAWQRDGAGRVTLDWKDDEPPPPTSLEPATAGDLAKVFRRALGPASRA